MWTYILITYIITQNRLFRMLKSKKYQILQYLSFQKHIFLLLLFQKSTVIVFLAFIHVRNRCFFKGTKRPTSRTKLLHIGFKEINRSNFFGFTFLRASTTIEWNITGCRERNTALPSDRIFWMRLLQRFSRWRAF